MKKVVIGIIAVIVIIGIIGIIGGGGSESSSKSSNSSSSQEKQSTKDMKIGATAHLDNGLEITLNEVETYTPEDMDKPITRVNVTYKNNGDRKQSFNIFDWQAEDADGVERSITVWSDSDDLGSGDLKSGGTVTGNLFFDGDNITTINYYGNIIFEDEPTVNWRIV